MKKEPLLCSTCPFLNGKDNLMITEASTSTRTKEVSSLVKGKKKQKRILGIFPRSTRIVILYAQEIDSGGNIKGERILFPVKPGFKSRDGVIWRIKRCRGPKNKKVDEKDLYYCPAIRRREPQGKGS